MKDLLFLNDEYALNIKDIRKIEIDKGKVFVDIIGEEVGIYYDYNGDLLRLFMDIQVQISSSPVSFVSFGSFLDNRAVFLKSCLFKSAAVKVDNIQSENVLCITTTDKEYKMNYTTSKPKHIEFYDQYLDANNNDTFIFTDATAALHYLKV